MGPSGSAVVERGHSSPLNLGSIRADETRKPVGRVIVAKQEAAEQLRSLDPRE